MSLKANFTRGCVFMEATVGSMREANNVLDKIEACNGAVIRTSGTYFAVIFTSDNDADNFLKSIEHLITKVKNEYVKL